MPAVNLYDMWKTGDMQFVYAAFFEHRDDVFVKVGRSARPYKRIINIATSSPLPLSQAVICQIGGVALALKFEKAVSTRLMDRRTRGEWYLFPKTDGKEFASQMAATFARITGRRLEWKSVDIDAIREQLAEAAHRFHGRYKSPKPLDAEKTEP